MSTETEVFDINNERILVGARVKNEWLDVDGEQIWYGTVKQITDPDGDVDDEGRMYGIDPVVCVQWDTVEDGDIEDVTTTHIGGYNGGPEYECEELEVVK